MDCPLVKEPHIHLVCKKIDDRTGKGENRFYLGRLVQVTDTLYRVADTDDTVEVIGVVPNRQRALF